ncbi:MAG TPA: ABC transporter ATP-binding protein [Candidatus Dormibacteraeota bacterium]|nr:ABC transporter ATP-binding protein [Candidatus Dormibacteraeota bacterium]
MTGQNVTAAVAFNGVGKRYGSLVALQPTDLAVPQGEIVAILGPNGAGKTTAVSLMLGLRAPSTGSVAIFGKNPRDFATRSRIGAMLQNSGVPEYLRVDEAIALFQSYYPKPMPTAELLQYCGLEEKATTRIARLSGGQLQRLYFALALCGDPELLVLDEPTVGLDVEARRGLLATISEIGKRGRTIVMTTHYLEEADALADRIVVIDRGSIIADGSPAEIKATVGRKRVSFTSIVSLDDAQFVRNGERYEITTEKPERILQELFARKLPIENLTVTGASLEEAFVHLTSHENAHVA